MKKILVLLLAISIIFVCLVSCESRVTYEEKETEVETEIENKVRFRRVYDQTNPDITIYVDGETNVMYMYHDNGYDGGLTVMLDENGNPLLWE